jgi:GTP cyclohydrolase I
VDIKTVDKVAELYAEIMKTLEIKETSDNRMTPLRVAKSLIEMTDKMREQNNWGNYNLDQVCTTFINNNKGVVVEQKDIEFSSMCSHHHLPFFGKVNIEYQPRETVIGLSKFKRIVDFFSNKPQVQEDFTAEIGKYLVDLLDPEFVKVEVVDCTHTCMCSRGVRSSATTNTKYNYARPRELEPYWTSDLGDNRE